MTSRLFFLALFAALASCDGESEKPRAGDTGGGEAGEGAPRGGDANAGGLGGAAGESGELGEGGAMAGQGGVGACSETAPCSEPERCADGTDNDLDGAADCDDAECERGCVQACSGAEHVSDPALVEGSNAARTHTIDLGCHSGAPAGNEVVYELVAEHDGTLDVAIDSADLFRVAVRGTCAEAESERACGLGSASAPVRRGETLFVIVQGLEATDASPFTLALASRPADECGDGVRDASEECDDENLEAGDGCDVACRVELTEMERNDARAEATPWSDPFYARIGSASDVDLVSLDIAAPETDLVASTLNLGDGACARKELDSVLSLLSAEGEVLASDDDGGDGSCARLAVPGLGVGRYYLRVLAAPDAEPATFPYRLGVDLDTCGNARVGFFEDCDDGNRLPGDGCSASCADE
jgi:cysteine-rich repeat protein